MMRPPPSSTRTYTLLPSTTRFRSILRREGQVKDKGKDLARNITVEQVRELKGRLNFSLSLGDWRVIVVDAIDDLEPGAANAFLKTLEEPPAKTLFLLVSHSPGRLLPPIRSRCRTLRFQPGERRSDERRVGKEGVSKCSSRGARDN